MSAWSTRLAALAIAAGSWRRPAARGIAALAIAAAGCSTVIDGKPACPGCGNYSEPTMPTAQPKAPGPTAAPPTAVPPSQPTRAPEPTVAAPPGAQTLPANDGGYVFVQTKSGKTRCQINNTAVGCESQFENAPEVDGFPANGVNVSASGNLRWILGNLGDIPAVTLDYSTYYAQGWTIEATSSGTRFTNTGTGHGMFIATQGVESF